jgi:hypothetical protein
MRTAGFDQVQLTVMLQQQQCQRVKAKMASVAIVQVDEFFQGLETHGGLIRWQHAIQHSSLPA